MRSRYVGVGIFVVVGSLLFATAVFLIGNQHNFFSKHIELFTEVKNLNGLAKGATIRVAGFDAGEVAEIGVPESPAAGFRLTSSDYGSGARSYQDGFRSDNRDRGSCGR